MFVHAARCYSSTDVKVVFYVIFFTWMAEVLPNLQIDFHARRRWVALWPARCQWWDQVQS